MHGWERGVRHCLLHLSIPTGKDEYFRPKVERIREGESKTASSNFYALHTGKEWTSLLRLRGVAVAELPPEGDRGGRGVV